MNNWISQIVSKGRKVYSQGNQDGMIEYIFQNIGTTNKFCIEFGFNSKTVTGGSGANTARLIVKDGWKALLLDGTYENLSINLHKIFLTPNNIVSVFTKFNVPKEPDYVSIDVDSTDLWLFKALIKGYRPRLISVEYNSNFPFEVSATLKPDKTKVYTGNTVYGASLLALHRAADFDYRLIAVENTLDLFFLRSDLIDLKDMPPLSDFKKFTGIPHNGVLDVTEFVEYPSMVPIQKI